MSERDLQRSCEQILRLKGYWPRTNLTLLGCEGAPPRGWYLHLPQARGNPYVLDLLVLASGREPLEIELKSENGRVRPEQDAILRKTGFASLARTTGDFFRLLEQWERYDCPSPKQVS